LCEWTDDDDGLQAIHWVNAPDDGENFSATVGLADGRNVLRFASSERMDERFATAAVQAIDACLRESQLLLDDIDAIVAAPASPQYRVHLAARLGVSEERIIAAEDQSAHTASLAGAFDLAAQGLQPDDLTLLVAAGAGITAGAALYRMPGPTARGTSLG
jgi:3-oxoacyl-[acyl-carrier-protein] synthase-3